MPVEVSLLLRNISSQIEAAKKARALYAPRFAPDFSSLRFMDLSEPKISSIIKFLLDPKEVHGQGDRFLRSFITQFELTSLLAGAGPLKVVDTEVRTNRIAAADRKIDLLLTFESGAVGIENKPWAADSEGQVRDYLEHLKNLHPERHCLIYLSGTGTAPAESSIAAVDLASASERGRLKIFGYTKLIAWLGLCTLDCAAANVRLFLDDLRAFIERRVEGKMDTTEQALIVEAITSSSVNLDAAIKISKVEHAVKLSLFRRLERQLRDELKGIGWVLHDFEPSRDDMYWAKYSGFYVLFAPTDRYGARFEFAKGYSEWVYGLCKIAEDLPDLPVLRDKLIEAIGPTQIPVSSFVWWDHAEPRDWTIDSQAWIDLYEGRVAKWIVDRSRDIYDALSAAKLLDSLNGHQLSREKL